MKKHVVLLSSAAAAPTLELIESLSSSGIAVRIEGLHDSELHGEEFSPAAADFPLADPIAILYEIAPDTAIEELRAVIELANAKWPGVSIVASRRSSEKTGAQSGPARSSVKAVGIPRGGRTARATSGAFAAGRRGPGHRRTQTTARIQELARQSRVFASHFGARREFAWRADVAVVASPGVESEGSRTKRARRHRASGRGQSLGDICHGANRRC